VIQSEIIGTVPDSIIPEPIQMSKFVYYNIIPVYIGTPAVTRILPDISKESGEMEFLDLWR